MAINRFRKNKIITIILISVFLSLLAGYQLGFSISSLASTRYEEGSNLSSNSYIFYSEDLTYYGRNGVTGAIIAGANIGDLVQNTFNALPSYGGSFIFKEGYFNFSTTLIFGEKDLTISGVRGLEGGTIIVPPAGEYAFIYSNQNLTVWKEYTVTITDLTIRGIDPSSNGIKIVDTYNPTLKNLKFENLEDALTFDCVSYWTENIYLENINTKYVVSSFRFINESGTGNVFHITGIALRMGVYSGGCGLYFENVYLVNSFFSQIHIGMEEEDTRGIRFAGIETAMAASFFGPISIYSNIAEPSNIIGIEFGDNNLWGGDPMLLQCSFLGDFTQEIYNPYGVPYYVLGT